MNTEQLHDVMECLAAGSGQTMRTSQLVVEEVFQMMVKSSMWFFWLGSGKASVTKYFTTVTSQYKGTLADQVHLTIEPACTCSEHSVHKQYSVPALLLRKSSASCLSVRISIRETTFGWLSWRRIFISRTAVIGKPSFSFSIRTFFSATSSPTSIH